MDTSSDDGEEENGEEEDGEEEEDQEEEEEGEGMEEESGILQYKGVLVIFDNIVFSWFPIFTGYTHPLCISFPLECYFKIHFISLWPQLRIT